MIPEDLSTKCSIGSMIQSDPMLSSTVDLGSLGNFSDWILDPTGLLMELVESDL